MQAYGIPVPDPPSFDLCKSGGGGASLSCPTTANQPVVAKVSYGISKLVPAGIDATIKLTFLDGASAAVGCVSFDIKVGDGSSSSSSSSGGVGVVGSMERSVESELSHLNPFAASRKLETAELASASAAAVETREAAAEEAAAPALAAARAKAAAVLASPSSKGAAAPPSALASLLRAPAVGAPESEQREMLRAAYAEQPEWGRLFGAWRAQVKKPAYATAAEEGRRFANFKQAILRLDAAKGAKADVHADKSADELRTFAHFA